MHRESLAAWTHDHSFGQERRRPGESRTWLVIAITAATMLVEIIAGLTFHSMALLADGLHMASHATALGIAAFAYAYTRRHARDARFCFGTGKVNSLGAFASAVLLALLALLMAGESLRRLFAPVAIGFDQAILVAVVGLFVNGLSLLVLRDGARAGHVHAETDSDHAHEHHHDHNLWAAYLHVLADALTSLLAIVALLAGKYFGLNWLDAVMGIVGAALVLRWGIGLLRASARVLLDHQAPAALHTALRESLEADGDSRVADLHVWAVGPGIYAAAITLIAASPREPAAYLDALPLRLGIVHATVEIRRCPGQPGADRPPGARQPAGPRP